MQSVIVASYMGSVVNGFSAQQASETTDRTSAVHSRAEMSPSGASVTLFPAL
jgi:hypothetical protein